MSEFFKVIKEGEIKCNHCERADSSYVIVFHDGIEECGTGESFHKEEDAYELCNALNWAFHLGLKYKIESKSNQS